MNSLSFLDIILIAGVSQGFFLAISLQFLKDHNKEANKVLVWILLISVLMLVGRLLPIRINILWVNYIALFADTTILLIGPLIYMYVRRLAFKEEPSFRLSLKHYVLAFLHVIYFFWYVSLNKEAVAEVYRTGLIYYFFFGVELLGVLSFGFYLFISIRLLRNYQTREHNELSNPQVVLRFLQVFLFVLVMCFLFWVISFVNTYFMRYDISFLRYTFLWISIPIFIYTIGFYSLRQPEIFRIPYKKPLQDRARLKPNEIETVQKRLLYFMQEERVFLNSDLTLQSLAKKLNTSSNNLSWFLNNIHNVSFSEYINQFRIENFLQKIEAGEHTKKTLLALAMEVGFNSKSNFNKVFKTQIGEPPSAYIKKKNVA